MISEAQHLSSHEEALSGSSESTVDPGHSAPSADFRQEGIASRVQLRSAGLRQRLLSTFWSFLEMQVEDVGLIALFIFFSKIYLFCVLAVLGLCSRAQAFSSCGERGPVSLGSPASRGTARLQARWRSSYAARA